MWRSAALVETWEMTDQTTSGSFVSGGGLLSAGFIASAPAAGRGPPRAGAAPFECSCCGSAKRKPLSLGRRPGCRPVCTGEGGDAEHQR